jgi:NAD+ kinase
VSIQSRYSNIVCYFDPSSEIAVRTFAEVSKNYPMIGSVHWTTNKNFQKNFNPDKKQLIITLGGDGMMLRALHEFVNDNVDVYGINLGSVGFLLNNCDLKNLLQKIDSAVITKLSPLEMKARTTDGKVFSAIAFNEVSLLRETSQTAKMSIHVNGKVRLSEMSGDGIMVATPAGSTAYNAAAHGPIVPLNANILLLTPINPFRPRRLSSILLPRNSIISLSVLEAAKRPVTAFADSSEIKNVEVVQVYERSDIKMSVLFDKDLSLDERILKEQFTT